MSAARKPLRRKVRPGAKSGQATEDGGAATKVGGAVRSRASPEELMAAIAKEIGSDRPSDTLPGSAKALSPKETAELHEVLKQLRQRLSTLRVGAVAMLEKHADTPEEKAAAEADGSSVYVEMKVQLLLSYIAGLTYYLLLKLRGISVRDHPVVTKLLWIRTLIEKLKPVDQRLQYQINKLLQWSDSKVGDELATAGFDPLSMKPGELASTVDQESDDEDADAVKAAHTDGVYRPPKIAQVEYTGDHIGMQDRAERDLERKKARLDRSEFVRSLREEFTDSPAEIKGDQRTAKAERAARLLQEQREYEENHMLRLRVAKAENKTQRRMLKMGRISSGGAVPLDDVTADFRELSRTLGSDLGGSRGKGKGKGKGRSRGSGSVLQEYHEAAKRVRDTRSAVDSALSGAGAGGQKRRAGGAKGGGKRQKR